jgi:hypothetical protein
LRQLWDAWKSIPGKWKKWAVLAALGWAVEAAFGVAGFVLLLVSLFLLGFALASFAPRRGRKVSGFAVEEIAGQTADFVSMPLLVPIGMAWWPVARDGEAALIGEAVGYTAVFLIARTLIPQLVLGTLEPAKRRPARRRR